MQVDDVVGHRTRRVSAGGVPQAQAAREPGRGQPRHPRCNAAEDRRGECSHREVAARTRDGDRGLADEHGPSDPRRLVEREPQGEQPAERVAHKRDLVDAEAIEHAFDHVDGLLADEPIQPEVRRRQAVAGEIDEQEPALGQAACERRHSDARGGDAVHEQHRVADARLEDTDPHRRRRDVDPTFLHVEPVRCRDALFDRPHPRLDPHRRALYDVVVYRSGRSAGLRSTENGNPRGVSDGVTDRRVRLWYESGRSSAGRCGSRPQIA